jgi:prevent-host-death family protein
LAYEKRKAVVMTTVTATDASKQFHKLLDDVVNSREPIRITSKRGSAVLVAEEDWRAVQETLYLISVPGMRESIREGMEMPVAECREDLGG